MPHGLSWRTHLPLDSGWPEVFHQMGKRSFTALNSGPMNLRRLQIRVIFLYFIPLVSHQKVCCIDCLGKAVLGMTVSLSEGSCFDIFFLYYGTRCGECHLYQKNNTTSFWNTSLGAGFSQGFLSVGPLCKVSCTSLYDHLQPQMLGWTNRDLT